MRWFTSWWAQAIDRGVTMAVAIWLVSIAVAVIGLFLMDWGPLAFLRFVSIVGSYILAIFLAFTAPLWVLGGLVVLVSLGAKETLGQRGATLIEKIGDGNDRSAQDANGRRGRFRRGWSRWRNNVEWGVVGWFVIRPVQSGRGVEIAAADVSALPDDTYLQIYVRKWIVQALVMFTALAFITGISTFAHKVEMPRDFLNPIVPAFAIALGVCNVAAVRYAVTRKVLKRLAAIDSRR